MSRFISKFAQVLPTEMAVEEMQAYMDQQPNLIAGFDAHAQAETLFFREVGLMRACDMPNIDFHPTLCETCGLPFFREFVLKAELER